MVLPVLVSQLCATGSPCLSASNPRLTYHAVSFGQMEDSQVVDTVDGTAAFNAFSPSLSTGMFDVVAPNASATESVSIDKTEFAQTPAKGFMVISHDNPSADEAQLISVRVRS